MSYFSTTNIKFADSGSVDAFSRLRVSQTASLFDAQFTYNLQPLLYEQLTNGAGATITHDTTDRCALMTLSSTPTGGYSYMQSYSYIPYQPGRSQLAFITFNFIEGVANVLKFAGLGDSDNGVFFQLNGTTPRLAILSGSGAGSEVVNQDNWNLDKLDGNGASQITLDITKTQILVLDLQALYVGRVRVGFDINGVVYYVHEFNHANEFANPYIQTANLPIRAGMQCIDTASTTMKFICSSVVSEGGETSPRGFIESISGTATASSGSRVHLLSLRPKTTFNSFTNRTHFELDSIDLLVTGNFPIKWELVIGQSITGATTYTDVNTAYSSCEYNTAGTISGTPAVVLASGFIPASAGNKASSTRDVSFRYPITLDASGAVRSLGTISLIVTGIGGSSACQGVLNWREVR